MNSIPPAWFDVPGFNWNNLSSNGRIAARWVHAGAEVFPCYSRVSTDARGNIHEVKTPKTPKGFKDATDDMLAVVTWWTANPDDLVGVSAGDHLTIIDIDMDGDKEEPVDGWASLHEAGLSVPEEFMVTTPRGGNHVYCRTPEGVFPNSVANLRLLDGTALKGVDRRARGGYFIGWSEEGIPDSIADLPFAPLEFCHVSSGSSQGVEYSGSVTDWLTSVGAGQPDALMRSVMRTKIPRGEFNHQEMRDIQRNILGVAAGGHPGGAVALKELRSEYLRGGYDTIRWKSDFNAALAGAVLKFGGAADADADADGDSDSDEKSQEQKSISMKAHRLAHELYEFFLAEEGDVLAVPLSGPRITLSMDGRKEFFTKFCSDYKARFGRTLSDKPYKEMAASIHGDCQQLPKVKAFIRIAEHEGSTFVDMGDETGRCIRIDSEGWRMEDYSPVLFRRTKLIAPLAEPKRGGTLTGFFDMLNLPVEKSKQSVYLGFLVSFYFPNISHPILYVKGAQGSAKSKVTEFTHRLLDASPVVNRKLPRSLHDWIVTAQASYAISLDNLSSLTPEMSDALCRAATGEADVVRALYENRGIEVFALKRFIALNGVDIGGIREDLQDRIVLMEPPIIQSATRLTDEEVYATFSAVSEEAFGALLNVVVKVKAALPTIRLAESPRMADFARILAALDETYGDLGALDGYLEGLNQDAMNHISSDPVLTAIKDVMTEPWEGTAKDLLDILNRVKPFDDSRGFFPKTARRVTQILARSGPTFSKIGMKVEDLGSQNHEKVKRWRITPPEPWMSMNPIGEVMAVNLYSTS